MGNTTNRRFSLSAKPFFRKHREASTPSAYPPKRAWNATASAALRSAWVVSAAFAPKRPSTTRKPSR